MSDDLVAFLLARIAEDEQVARATFGGAEPPRWTYREAKVWDTAERPIVRVGHTWNREGAHIARWDPARVLAECEAKRAILAEHSRPQSDLFTHCEGIGGQHVTEDINECPMLRAVALAYWDHPDYRSEWTPQEAR